MVAMAYRDATAPRRPTAVLRYRPMRPVATFGLMALFGFVSLVTFFQALTYVRSVELECVRGGPHTCTVLRHYGPLTTHQAIPIQNIHSVSITAHKTKNTTNYAAVLFTKSSETIQLMRATARHIADARRLAVEQVVFDRMPGTQRLFIDESVPVMGAFFALLGLGLAALSLMFFRSARLEFDFDRGAVRYTRLRWPLRPVRRTLRADEVKRARVTARPGSKGSAVYGVALVLDDETDLELLSQGGGGEQHHQRAADAINAHLAKLHEEHPPR